MRLNNREKKLLQVLCGIILLLFYYYIIVNPQLIKLNDLQREKEIYSNTIHAVEKALISMNIAEKEIQAIQQKISKQTSGYFESIDQGTIILLIDDMTNKSNLQIPSITFSEYKMVNIADKDLNTITTTISFEGNFEVLMKFLKEIRIYEKRIIITDLQIQNNMNGYITGNMLLEFYSLRDEKNAKIPSSLGEVISYKDNPFTPFKGYIEEILNIQDGINNNNSYSDFQIEFPDTFIQSKVTILLSGFEDLNTFFVGDPRDILGELSLDSNTKEGQYSLRVNYNFYRPRQTSSVNVVFDGNKVKLERQPEKVKLSIYAFENNNHSISLIIKDAKGKDYIVPLTQQVNWIGWRSLEGSLPLDISYPAEIQRINIMANNFDPIINGTLLLDQLEAVYPYGYTQEKDIQATSESKTYIVKEEDTLFSITKKFYGDYTKRFLIMEYNGILDPNHIEVGQTLLIPME